MALLLSIFFFNLSKISTFEFFAFFSHESEAMEGKKKKKKNPHLFQNEVFHFESELFHSVLP